eukprot:SM000031S11602  [mRNA]  locus=s31:665544:666934:+ [translate_table: standard]
MSSVTVVKVATQEETRKLTSLMEEAGCTKQQNELLILGTCEWHSSRHRCAASRAADLLVLQNQLTVCRQKADGISEAKAAAKSIARTSSRPSLVGRLLTYKAPGELAKVGRIATSTDFRRQGVARAMLAIHNEARHLAYAGCYLGAQLDACNFYLSLGYTFQSEEVFLDAGIRHRWMQLIF